MCKVKIISSLHIHRTETNILQIEIQYNFQRDRKILKGFTVTGTDKAVLTI